MRPTTTSVAGTLLDSTSEFQKKATRSIMLAALLFLVPFGINHFLQERWLLGAVVSVVVAALSLNTWLLWRDRYNATLIFAGMVPALLFALSLALQRQGVIGVLWCYPAVLIVYFTLPERLAWWANAMLLVVLLPQAWMVLGPPIAPRAVATLLTLSSFSALFVRVIASQQRQLVERAITDTLTGLANRAQLMHELERALEQARRAGTEVSLVSLDIDHFKAINDNFGHAMGDEVLRRVGEFLRQRVRAADKAFRIGGEEFLLLLHASNTEASRHYAEELRRAIATRPLVPDRAVTISAGVATAAADESVEDWMRRSDANLYRAKAAGRDCVVA